MKILFPATLAAFLALPAYVFPAETSEIDALIRELRAVNPDRRVHAAESLGDLGPQAAPAIRSLLAALTDPSTSVQIEVLFALERMGSAAKLAVPDLVKILKRDNSDLHGGAIAALASIGRDAADAAPALIEFLDKEDEGLATSAGLALARILPEESDDLLQVIPILVKSLKSEELLVRSEAVSALGAAGRVAIPALVKIVKGHKGDGDSAWRASAALMSMGPLAEQAVPVLVEALQSDNEQVVIHAAGALGAIGEEAKPAVSQLQKLLSSASASIRTHAASALGDLGQAAEAAVGGLLAALEDSDEGVRRESAEALGKIGPAARPAVAALVGVLNDQAGSVAVHAGWALSRIGPDAVPDLVAALKDEMRQHLIVVILGDIGAAAKPAAGILAEFLSDPDLDPDFGREILLTLARIGPDATEAVPELLKILEDKEHPLRAGAAYALAKLGAKKAVTLLIQALPQKDDSEMRVVVPIALVLLNPESDYLISLVLPRLIDLLGDESNLVRHEAATTLASLGPRAADAVPDLAAGLTDPDPSIRGAYLSTLGAIGPAAADSLPAIMKSLVDADFPVRCSASYAIGRIGSSAQEAIPVLEKNLQARDELLQIASAWALVHVNPKRRGLADLCLGPLTRGLKLTDPRARREAAEALGMIGSAARPAATALEAIARDPDENVRKSVAAALKKIAR